MKTYINLIMLIFEITHGQRNNILKLNLSISLFSVWQRTTACSLLWSSMKASQLASQYSGWSVGFHKEGSGGGDASAPRQQPAGAPEFFWSQN